MAIAIKTQGQTALICCGIKLAMNDGQDDVLLDLLYCLTDKWNLFLIFFSKCIFQMVSFFFFNTESIELRRISTNIRDCWMISQFRDYHLLALCCLPCFRCIHLACLCANTIYKKECNIMKSMAWTMLCNESPLGKMLLYGLLGLLCNKAQ